MLITGGGRGITDTAVEILPPAGFTCSVTIPELPGALKIGQMIIFNGIPVSCGGDLFAQKCYRYEKSTNQWQPNFPDMTRPLGITVGVTKLSDVNFLVSGT